MEAKTRPRGRTPDLMSKVLSKSFRVPLMDSHETARRIRIMRAAIDLTQPEMGLLLNRSKATIGRWEQGRGLPDDFVLAELAARCGFDRTYFVDEDPRLPKADEAKEWRRAYEGWIAAAPEEAARAAEEAARQGVDKRQPRS